jgi:ribosomal protein L11 methyltransferase
VAELVQAAEGSLGGGAALGHWLGWEQVTSPKSQDPGPGDLPYDLRPATCDLIVANIIARVLAALAADLAGALARGGILIASGIIAEREAEVVEAFATAGLTAVERRQEGDWVALVYQMRAAA